MRKILNILSNILLAMLVVVALLTAALRITGGDSALFGLRLYYVVTGSMEPTLHVGDMVLCRETSPDRLQQGDILVYRGAVGDLAGKTITHRITQPPAQQPDGSWQIQTQGDAPGTAPDPLVDGSQVIGVVLLRLRLLSVLYKFFVTPWGLLALVVPLSVALVSELRTLFALVREEPSDDESDAE